MLRTSFRWPPSPFMMSTHTLVLMFHSRSAESCTQSCYLMHSSASAMHEQQHASECPIRGVQGFGMRCDHCGLLQSKKKELTRLAVRTRLGRLGCTAMSLIASPCPSATCKWRQPHW